MVPQMTLAEFWRVVRKRRLTVLACVAAALSLAALYAAIYPRRYEAVARVVVNPENSNALGLSLDLGMGRGVSTNEIMQQTQVRVMQSDPLVWEVIRQLRLDQRRDFAGDFVLPPQASAEGLEAQAKSQLLSRFHRGLKVKAVPGTQLIEVRFRDRDPQLAAAAANALTSGYIERNFRTRYDATMQASDWLAKQIEDLKERVQSAQQRFAEYQKQNGIIGTDESHNIVLVRLDELNKQLAQAQAERIMREARYRVAASGNPELIAEVAPSSTLAILRAQQAELRNQQAQLSAKYGDAYPRVAQLRSQLEQVEAGLRAEIANVRGRLENEYRAAQKSQNMLDEELQKQKQEAYQLAEAGNQFAILKRDVESSRDLYEGLLKKLKEAGILAGLRSTNVDIIDPAAVPTVPAEPRVKLSLGLGLLLGLGLGLGLAFLLENLDTTISTPEQVEFLGNVAMMGVVPHLPRGRQRAALVASAAPTVLSSPDSAFAESFRALRTTVLLSLPGAPPKVLLVSSALPGDGKTTTSINCAMVLAQRRRRVLLVDADLRRCSIHSSLRMEQGAGLTGCLAGTAEPEQSIVQLPELPALEVLFAGHRPPNPFELLDSERMRGLLQHWRQQYEHIVIDSPPLLGLADAVVLATMADAVLLVARSTHTGRQSLRRACDQLGRVNARLIGVVLNDLNANSSEHYDYYGYYGSKYGHYYGREKKG